MYHFVGGVVSEEGRMFGRWMRENVRDVIWRAVNCTTEYTWLQAMVGGSYQDDSQALIVGQI